MKHFSSLMIALVAAIFGICAEANAQERHWDVQNRPNGQYHLLSLTALLDENGNSIQNAEVGIFLHGSGQLAGCGMWNNNPPLSMRIWAADSGQANGFYNGQWFFCAIWLPNEHEMRRTITEGEPGLRRGGVTGFTARYPRRRDIQLVHWERFNRPVSPNNHSVIAYLGELDQVEIGMELAAISENGEVVGAGVYDPFYCGGRSSMGVAVMGDVEELDDEVEGLLVGDRFTFRLWRPSNDQEEDVVYCHIRGPEAYETGALTEVMLVDEYDDLDIIPLNYGVNLISIWCEPAGDQSVASVLGPTAWLRSVIVRNDVGQFYCNNPQFSNLGDWSVNEGYSLKLSNPEFLVIKGRIIPDDREVSVTRNWNLVPYFPEQQIPPSVAFNDLGDNLLIAKDSRGRFYLPAADFSNMNDLCRGQAYQIKVERNASFIWSVDEGDRARSIEPSVELTHFTEPAVTISNMSLLIRDVGGEYEVAAYSFAGLLVGAGKANILGQCGLAIWGDDPDTKWIEGLKEGEEVKFVLWDGLSEQRLNLTEKVIFRKDGQQCPFVDGVVENNNNPKTLLLRSAYPNPFNSSTRLNFELPASLLTRLAVYDLTGREVIQSINGHLSAGSHIVVIDANGLPAGLYVVRLEFGGLTANQKVLLVK